MSFDVVDPSSEDEASTADYEQPATVKPQFRWIPPSLPNVPSTNVAASNVSVHGRGSRKRPGAVIAMSALGMTVVAFLVAIAQIVRGTDTTQDWMSPPFALVGGLLVILAMARRLKPGHLLISTILLNASYWLYFLLMFLSSGN